MKSKKDNYLLYAGAGIFSCTSLLYLLLDFYNPTLLKNPDKFGDLDSVVIIFLRAVIIAPITEELTFRGYFLKNKIFTYVFLGGSSIFILLTGTYYVFSILLILAILEFVFKVNRRTKIIYFLNTLLFAVIHYKLSHFTNIYSVIPIFFQFSIGLILVWITINYSLVRSMLAHFCVNFLAMGSVIIALQYPDTKTHTVRTDHITFIYSKTPALGNESMRFTTSNVQAHNSTIRNFARLLNLEEKSYEVNDTLRYYRYNFTIKNLTNEKLESSEVQKILMNAKLIEPAKGVKNKK